MSINLYEYKSNVNYSDLNSKGFLSTKGLMRMLQEAAGLHSDIFRLWNK